MTLQIEVDGHDRYTGVIQAKPSRLAIGKLISVQLFDHFVLAPVLQTLIGATMFFFVLVWTLGCSSVAYASSPSLRSVAFRVHMFFVRGLMLFCPHSSCHISERGISSLVVG